MIQNEKRKPADNPTSALFDLAEAMANNYERISYLSIYAYVFIGLNLIIFVILAIAGAASGNVALALISIAVIISGVMLLRLVVFTHGFLKDFYVNFRAISYVREADPMPPVPEAKDPVSSLEIYLRESDFEARDNLKKGGEIYKGRTIGGRKWDIALIREGGFISRSRYMLLAAYMKGKPRMAHITEVERALDGVGKEMWPPSRVILLYRLRGFDGVSDDLYNYLVDREHFLLKGGKKHPYKLQIFVQTDRRYEIIPLLP